MYGGPVVGLCYPVEFSPIMPIRPAELLPELEIVNCAQEGASCASQQLIGSTGVSSCIYGI